MKNFEDGKRESMMPFNDESCVSAQTSNSLSVTSQSSHSFLSLGPEYQFLLKIGSGNFGEVWLGKNHFTDEKVAIKIEKIKRSRKRTGQLALEYELYKKFGPNKYMPVVYQYFEDRSFKALILELMGQNLEEIFINNNKIFSTKTIFLIAIKVIQIIQFVHCHGIVFRDVKPQNFVVGLGNKSQNIFIIDFGLSKYYIDHQTKKHIPYRDHCNLTGTARYMSINTHMGLEQSRRDDLESIGHMLVFFAKGRLPWQGLKTKEGESYVQKIGKVKRETKIEDLCKNLHPAFSTYLKHSRSLTFYQKPNYDFLLNLFTDAYRELGFSDETFDWETENINSYQSILSLNGETAFLSRTYPNLCDLKNYASNSVYDNKEDFQHFFVTNSNDNIPRNNASKPFSRKNEYSVANKGSFYRIKNFFVNLSSCLLDCCCCTSFRKINPYDLELEC